MDKAGEENYLVNNEIALASRQFDEGEFVKTCMTLRIAGFVCPGKLQAFATCFGILVAPKCH